MSASRSALQQRNRGLLTLGQIARATAAATGSYVAASALDSSAIPIFAPITALMVVQPSAYATFGIAVQRIAATIGGVLLAAVIVTVLGVNWWSFGLAVLLALLIARRLPFATGGQMQLPVAVVFVVAVGGTAWSTDLMRIIDVVIGGAAGLIALSLPPPRLPLARSGRAQDECAIALAAQLRAMANQIGAGPVVDGDGRYPFLVTSRELRRNLLAVTDADEQVEQGRWFNPRASRHREECVWRARRSRWLSAITLQVRALAGVLDRLYGPVAAQAALDRDSAGALLMGCADLFEVAYRSGETAAQPQAAALTEQVRTCATRLATGEEVAEILDSMGVLGRVHVIIGLCVGDPVHGEVMTDDGDRDGNEGRMTGSTPHRVPAGTADGLRCRDGCGRLAR